MDAAAMAALYERLRVEREQDAWMEAMEARAQEGSRDSFYMLFRVEWETWAVGAYWTWVQPGLHAARMIPPRPDMHPYIWRAFADLDWWWLARQREQQLVDRTATTKRAEELVELVQRTCEIRRRWWTGLRPPGMIRRPDATVGDT